MKDKKNILRITTHIFVVIAVMLFFVFVLTYDFTNPKKYNSSTTFSELSDNIYDYINDVREESYTLNILKVGLEEEFINDFISLYLYENSENKEYFYKTEYWTLKGMNINIKDEKIAVSLYASFHASINYKLKIKIFFDFVETRDSLNLSIAKLQIGTFTIPKSVAIRIISKDEDDTIGNAVNGAISNLPFGKYDIKSATYTLNKKEILSSIEDGFLGDLIERNKGLKDILSPLIYIVFTYNLTEISIKDDKISIDTNYSRIISSDETIKSLSYYSELKNNNWSNKDIEYKNAFKILLNENISLNEYEIDSYYLKTLKENNFLDDDSIISLDFGTVSIYNNEVHLNIVFTALEKMSLIDYKFVFDGSDYVLGRIDIGKDDKESSNSYISISDQEGRKRLLNLLCKYGINVDINNETIDFNSLFGSSALPIEFKKINDSSFDFKTQKSNIKEDFKSALSSNEFNSTLDSGIYIDTSSTTKMIESFESLPLNLKEIYFKKIKDYYKDNTSVYNYICGLVG